MQIKPIIFLIFLFVILAFILGVRYGQRVEKTNKVIDFVLNLPTPTPYPIKPITFNEYENTPCGINLFIPSSLNKSEETSTSAKFNEFDKQILQFDCGKNSALEKTYKNEWKDIADLQFQGKKLTAKTKNNQVIFSISNTNNSKTVFFKLTKPLLPLLERSLEF